MERIKVQKLKNESHTLLLRIIIVLFLLTTSCKQEYRPLPGGYKVFRHSRDEIFVSPEIRREGDPYIPPKVIKLYWNDFYIIGECQLMTRRSPNNPNDTTMIPDTSQVVYWIIDITENSRIGPFDKMQFLEWIDSANLSKDMSFVSPPF